MKDFLIDLCLVGLLIFMINGLLGDFRIQKEMFVQNIDEFEMNIKAEKPLIKEYGMINDNEENTLSLVIKKISDGCIKVIEILVLIISNIISTLL